MSTVNSHTYTSDNSKNIEVKKKVVLFLFAYRYSMMRAELDQSSSSKGEQAAVRFP